MNLTVLEKERYKMVAKMAHGKSQMTWQGNRPFSAMVVYVFIYKKIIILLELRFS